MAELQFKVDQTALETVKDTVISANFDEMKTALTEFAKPYASVIVSEDAIGIAKADRARIRAVSKHIDDYRKAVKSVYTEPLKVFEGKCKELTEICDNAALNIDTQIKEYDNKRREEKLFLLKDFFDNARSNMEFPEYVTWEQILNEKWGNVTYSLDTARDEISTACNQVDKDIKQIVMLSSDFQIALLDEYKKHHDVFAVFQMQERLAAQKLREEQRQIELESQYREERAEKVAEQSKNQSNPKPVKKEEEQNYVATYKVYGTYEQIMEVQQMLNTYDVRFMFEGMVKTAEPVEVAFG